VTGHPGVLAGAIQLRWDPAAGPVVSPEALEGLWQRAEATRLNRRVPATLDPERILHQRTRMNAPGGWLLVALRRGTVLAYGLGFPARVGGTGTALPGAEHLGTLAVEPSWWGRGLGGALVASICRELRDRGVWRLDAYVEFGNTRARGLYARAGFRPTRVRECENEPAPGRGLIQYVWYPRGGGDGHGAG
jgi:GNAT superfamily N-acetyltransferase